MWQQSPFQIIPKSRRVANKCGCRRTFQDFLKIYMMFLEKKTVWFTKLTWTNSPQPFFATIYNQGPKLLVEDTCHLEFKCQDSGCLGRQKALDWLSPSLLNLDLYESIEVCLCTSYCIWNLTRLHGCELWHQGDGRRMMAEGWCPQSDVIWVMASGWGYQFDGSRVMASGWWHQGDVINLMAAGWWHHGDVTGWWKNDDGSKLIAACWMVMASRWFYSRKKEHRGEANVCEERSQNSVVRMLETGPAEVYTV